MSIASQGTDIARFAGAVASPRSGLVRAGDFFALMKPRVMSLVVFTALCGLLAAPGRHDPVVSLVAILCISAGSFAAGALNMWYDADIDAVMSRTAMRPTRLGTRFTTGSPCIRPRAHSRRRFCPGSCSQCCRGRAARLHDFLLRRRLYRMVKAPNRSEHRHRGRRRRISSGDRLGCGDRRRRGPAARPVPHNLPLDTASFLGVVAQSCSRLCSRRRPNVASRRREPRNKAPDLHLQFAARRRFRFCPGCSGPQDPSTRDFGSLLNNYDHVGVEAPHKRGGRTGGLLVACSRSPSFTCSPCSRRC